MQADSIEWVDRCTDSAISTMRAHKVPTTPQNFAIWYEYYDGGSPDLRRAIDILTSNGQGFGEALLEELYEKFFAANSEQRALRETSRRVEDTLKEVAAAVAEAGDNTPRFRDALRDISGDDVVGESYGADR